jgi:hypothetical protein
MSALPPIADMCSALAYVRFVPIADITEVYDAPLISHVATLPLMPRPRNLASLTQARPTPHYQSIEAFWRTERPGLCCAGAVRAFFHDSAPRRSGSAEPCL